MITGTVVMSRAGHDKNQLYVVVGEDGKNLLLCDGKCRLISKPKKKNIKHLKSMELYVDLSKYNPLYDAHIRKELGCLFKKGGCSLG